MQSMHFNPPQFTSARIYKEPLLPNPLPNTNYFNPSKHTLYQNPIYKTHFNPNYLQGEAWDSSHHSPREREGGRYPKLMRFEEWRPLISPKTDDGYYLMCVRMYARSVGRLVILAGHFGRQGIRSSRRGVWSEIRISGTPRIYMIGYKTLGKYRNLAS